LKRGKKKSPGHIHMKKKRSVPQFEKGGKVTPSYLSQKKKQEKGESNPTFRKKRREKGEYPSPLPKKKGAPASLRRKTNRNLARQKKKGKEVMTNFSREERKRMALKALGQGTSSP